MDPKGKKPINVDKTTKKNDSNLGGGTGQTRTILDQDGIRILVPHSEDEERAQVEEALLRPITNNRMTYPSLVSGKDNDEVTLARIV